MAHFAELDENNIVLRVIVVSNEDIKDKTGNENEKVGISFLHQLFGISAKWVQTSYNARFRGKYAGIGDFFDESNDIFISPTKSEDESQ